MTGKLVLKVSGRVTAYATFATLAVVLSYIWGSLTLEYNDVLRRLLGSGIVVVLAAAVINTLSRDLILSEEKRVLSRLAYTGYAVSVVSSIIGAVILLPMIWGLLTDSIVLTKMLSSVAALFLAAVMVLRTSGISPGYLNRDSATL